ncbi:MAG TPA: SH3 domain-containing protein [Gammaproteobacteria bacterium]|jgi:uncharacterized protein YgiM (DUF1202 family)|nr:SH3 domain-containing protein [Gammaproteobacteria bacterium]
MRRWSIGIAVLLLVLGAVHAASTSTAQTVVAGNLTSGPYSDASIVAPVPNAAQVTIIERQGGWYHVRLDSGKDGWLPMTSIRLNSTSTGSGWGTSWFSLFQSGRSGASGSTATTGVRGLNTGDIQNAKPDPKAVAELDQWQMKPAQAQAYAERLPLTAKPDIAYIPKVKP